MPKKELPTQIRQMQMFRPLTLPRNLEGGAPMPKTDAEDKDATIRQLRATLALFEAERAAVKDAQRARLAKHREKKRAKE